MTLATNNATNTAIQPVNETVDLKKKGIKKFIRFKGLFSFIAVMAVILALLYIFAEFLVKSTIEQGGGMLLGAEVNIAEVELQYSPLMLTIHQLQATDAEQPSHNIVSFKQANASIDIWQYLLGKTIIEQLNVESLEFMSKRAKVGDVYRQIVTKGLVSTQSEEKSKQEQSLLPSVDLQLPDVKSLLQDSDLLTVQSAQALQQSYKEERAKLTALKEKLPSKAKLKAYQVKVKALSKMKVKSLDDFNKIKAEFDSLKITFKADKATIKTAKTALLASKKRLEKQLVALKNAPNKDWKNIEKKYQLESINTEDFAHILFGEKARGYYQKAEAFYQRIAPMLSTSEDDKLAQIEHNRATGRFVYFDETSPLPAFLIKNAKLSLVFNQGDFVIDAQELTHQHWYRAKPSVVKFTSTNLFSTGKVTVDSQFNVTKKGDLTGNAQWNVKQLTLDDIHLNETKSLSLTLETGMLSGEGQLNFNQQDQSNHIASSNHFDLHNAHYQGSAKSSFSKILLNTFNSLDDLTLDIGIKGEIANPKLSMSSSLDQAIKGAFEQQIKDKLGDFKRKVNTGLNEKLAQSLKINAQGKAELIDFEVLLGDTDNALDTLKNSDVVKQQKKKLQNKAKDKLQNKLKDKLSDLFG